MQPWANRCETRKSCGNALLGCLYDFPPGARQQIIEQPTVRMMLETRGPIRGKTACIAPFPLPIPSPTNLRPNANAMTSRPTNVTKTNQCPAFVTHRRKEVCMHPHAEKRVYTPTEQPTRTDMSAYTSDSKRCFVREH